MASSSSNTGKITFTGKKGTDKFYYRHSGYPGGFRKASLNEALEKKPGFPLEHAIRGMLPRNRLGSAMFRKLRVYAGAEHPHMARLRQRCCQGMSGLCHCSAWPQKLSQTVPTVGTLLDYQEYQER